jgi:hypothetical protein
LQRMGVSRLDIAFVHDISSDNKLLPTPWQEQFAIALKGAFPALSRMREEGIINGWGIGVNTPEPILLVMQESDPDVCLLASQYSLIDHSNALNNVFPVARQRNVKFVIGSSLNAGFISGSPRYNYGKTSWNIPRQYIEKRERLRTVAAQFGADLRTAAVQFSAAPDRRGIDRRRAYRGASPCQCELYAGDDSAGVLGRVEAAEPYRAERARAYGVEILKTAVAKLRQDELIVGEVCLAFALANENL